PTRVRVRSAPATRPPARTDLCATASAPARPAGPAFAGAAAAAAVAHPFQQAVRALRRLRSRSAPVRGQTLTPFAPRLPAPPPQPGSEMFTGRPFCDAGRHCLLARPDEEDEASTAAVQVTVL